MKTQISRQVVVVEDIVPMMTITVLPPTVRNNGIRQMTEAIVGLMVVSKDRLSLIYFIFATKCGLQGLQSQPMRQNGSIIWKRSDGQK